MKKNLFIGLFVCLLMVMGNIRTAMAEVLTFDTLGGGNDTLVPSGYGGFNWNNMDSYFYSDYNTNYQNTLTPVSGNVLVYNSNGTSASMSSVNGTKFNFNDAYIAGWTSNNAGWAYNANTVTIDGYNKGVLVDSYTAHLTGSMTDFAVNLKGVDQVTFTSDGNNKWFVMDNVSTSAVPEPSTYALMGIGGLLLAFKLKKSRLLSALSA